MRQRLAVQMQRVCALLLGFVLLTVNLLPFAFTSSAYAAGLAIDKTVVKHQTGASTSITSGAFTTSQAGELLEVFLMADGPNPGSSSFSSVTGAGLTWSLRTRSNAQAGASEIWQAWAPNVLTNVTVKATRASGSYNGSMVIVSFTGAAQTQTGATAIANAGTGTPSVSLTTTANGSWVFGVGNDWDSATARTLGSGQTMIDQYMSNTGDDFWTQRQMSVTPGAGTSVTTNDTAPVADRWNLAAIEVVAAAGIDTQAPSVPANVVANAPAPNQVTLNWAASTDNVGVVGYKVFRGGMQIATITALSYTDTSVIPSTNYTYNVSAYDAAGNGSALSADASVSTPPDTTAPTIAVTAPASGTTVSGATTLTASASDNIGVTSVQFQIDGANVGALDTAAPYSIAWDSTTVADGAHAVTAVATDAANNTTTSSIVTINVNNAPDTQAPTVGLSAPVGGSTVSGTISVAATASDNVGVVGVQFRLDGSNLGAENTTSPYNMSWNTTSASNGTHTLTAVARDAAGNVATSDPVTVIVNNDVTPPAVAITAPLSGATVSGTTSITASASDNVGVVGVQFKVDGTALGVEDTASPYTVSWNTNSVSNGTHTLTAVARDAAGNTATSATVTVTVSNVSGINFTVDGNSTLQTIDGLGVNAIPKTWEGGALKPAIDTLVGAGTNTWRVDVGSGHSDWELNNDDSDPFTFNWNYYNSLYGGPQFSDLWNELSYLNSKGVSNIELSMSGLVPKWMSSNNDGHTITAANEDEFVEETVSLLYYAKNVKGIRYASISPLNETDKSSPEGPTVDATQFARILGKLATRLDQVGLNNVAIVGPHTSNFETTYTNAILANPTAMSHIKGFSYHSYGTTANAPSFADLPLGAIKASQYPGRQVYVGEWNNAYTDNVEGNEQVANEWNFARELTDELLNHLDDGASQVLQWDAWDNWHQHDPCCAYSGWGMVYQDNTNNWVTRKRLYTNEQIFRFVAPGMTKVTSSGGNSNITFVAFKNQATGQVTIVGHNRGSTATNMQVSMSGMPNVSSLAYYQTNSTLNMAQQPDALVSNGALSFQVPADTFFTLSNVTSVIGDSTAGPAISNLTTTQITPTSATVTWTTDRPSTSQVFYGTTGTYDGSTALDSTLTTNHSVVISGLNPDTMYHFQARSTDSYNVTNASADGHVTTLLSNGNQSLAIDNIVSLGDIKSNSTLTVPAFSTTQGNELLELFISSNGGFSEAASSVTGGGLSWSLRTRSNSHNGTSEIWQAVAPQALSNATITITMNQNTYTTATLASFIGARTDINGATATATGASGASSVTVNTQQNASWVWAVGNDWSNEAAHTPAAGQTLQYQLPILANADTFWVQSSDNQTHTAGTPITVNDTAPTGDMWNMAAIEIVPSFSVPDSQPPTAPTNLSAVANSPTQVALSWTASTDNIGVAGYRIYRNGLPIATTASANYIDNNLSPNATYTYLVVAYDAAANVSLASDPANVTTPPDTTPPAVSAVSASGIGSTSATILWTTDEPATTQVNYGTTAAYGSSTTLNSSLATAHAQALSGLTANTTYHYQVVSTDASGNTTASGDFTFTTMVVQTQNLAIDTSITTHQSSGGTSITSSAFSTTQVGDLLLAFITSDGPNAAGAQSFSSVTGGGLTWSLRARSNTQAGTAEIWQAAAPLPLTNVTVTAQRANGSYSGSMTVVAFKGANTSVNGAAKTANAATGAPSISLTTTANGSWAWAVGDDWDRATSHTVGLGQTMVDQYLAPTGDTFWTQRQTNATPTAGTSVTINDTAPTADRWNLALIEILPAN